MQNIPSLFLSFKQTKQTIVDDPDLFLTSTLKSLFVALPSDNSESRDVVMYTIYWHRCVVDYNWLSLLFLHTISFVPSVIRSNALPSIKWVWISCALSALFSVPLPGAVRSLIITIPSTRYAPILKFLGFVHVMFLVFVPLPPKPSSFIFCRLLQVGRPRAVSASWELIKTKTIPQKGNKVVSLHLLTLRYAWETKQKKKQIREEKSADGKTKRKKVTILSGFPVHLCNAFIFAAVYIPRPLR